jgi:signal peptidase I
VGRHQPLRDVADVVLVALLLALFARTFVVQAFRIPTGSMEPNLRVGDHLLVNKFVYGGAATSLERALLPLREPGAGDVAVFRFPRDPGQDFVKRIVGVPGSELSLRRRVLRRDGLTVPEPYAHHSDARDYPDTASLPEFYRRRDNLAPLVVPAGSYFVLGDNRDVSEDSRFWGLVPRHYLKGRALLVYWSRPRRQAAPSPAPDDGAPPRPGPGGWPWRPRLVR